MTRVADEAAITHRWRQRLTVRRHLLEDAIEDLHDARTAAERDEAHARISLRHEQVKDAKLILARHAKPKLTARERAVRAAMLGYAHRDEIHYTQDLGKRWEGIAKRRRAGQGEYPRSADCSSFVTWCLWDALGGPDAGPDVVNGQLWQHGNTNSQTPRGREVPIARAMPGDLAFYGPSRGEIGHVTIVVSPGRVISHGSEPGPLLLPIDYARPAGGVKVVRRYLP